MSCAASPTRPTRRLATSARPAARSWTSWARLLVDYRPDALRIEIRNTVRTRQSAAAGTGNGLTGMRERAHAVGGSLDAGLDPHGPSPLDARLPLPHLPAEDHAAALETAG